MTQHTAGPWALGAGRTFTTPDGEFYLTYGRDRHDNPKFKNFCALDANARLIAAAPEMLQALKDLTEGIDLSKLNVRKYFHLLNVHACATKAIAKAEGRP